MRMGVIEPGGFSCGNGAENALSCAGSANVTYSCAEDRLVEVCHDRPCVPAGFHPVRCRRQRACLGFRDHAAPADPLIVAETTLSAQDKLIRRMSLDELFTWRPTMRRTLLLSATLLALLLVSASVAEEKDEKKAEPFIAKDLSNWEGLIKEYWTYKDGELVGYTGEKGISFNTFLCSKKKYKDFEMKFKVRLKDGGGNSGVQIRSKIADAKQFAVAGPQCDIGAGYWGSLYGERFGGMMKAAPGEIQKAVKGKDFNDYYIKCVGKKVTIKINGKTSIDEEFEKMPDEGIIAFQLHGGGSMEVTFKDIEFKELKQP
jgi:hypothetical protein